MMSRLFFWFHQVWEREAAIQFEHETNPNQPVDFNIEWYRGNQVHVPDSVTFDGPGGELAHAFIPWEGNALPTEAGDVHIDGDEDFTDGTSEGE